MGLSRNKVAVSEGAAGSPPFYGESDIEKCSENLVSKVLKRFCSILKVLKASLKKKKHKTEPKPLTWGCKLKAELHLPKQPGGVAQLGEHLPCTQGVRSSILLISTNKSLGRKNNR